MLTKVSSPLAAEVEDVAHRAIGCLITVHRILGPGFREVIYKRAACLEFESQNIRYECEKRILVPYRDWKIPGQTLDLVVEGTVVIELKAVPRLKNIHTRQLVSYLKASHLRLGLLVNFNSPTLRAGLKRVVA